MALIPGIPIWIFIVAAFLLVVIFLIKFSNDINVLTFIKKNFFYFFLLLFLAIIVISVVNIHSKHDFDYSSLDGWKSLFKAYLSWLGSIFSNIIRVTGYAINQDWTASGNSTG